MAEAGAQKRSAGRKPSRRKKAEPRPDALLPDVEASAPLDPEADLYAEATARIGERLAGKWTLDALLGVGGMAAVYAATHRNGHRVAIKVLHPAMAHSRSLRERFLREGWAANRVDHAGVARVLDDDELPGRTFLVMELLEGETVESRWLSHDSRLPLAEVLGIADELLAILGAAHRKGILHRDIKPENLFLTNGGALKVLDFGVASIREASPGAMRATRTGIAVGTPAFMAPEQALGKSRSIDGRSDLWAVAATMFTLLTGRWVHLAESPSEMLVKAATQPATSIATLLPELPRVVQSIVDRALSFDASDRYTDAWSMRAAVHQARISLGYLDVSDSIEDRDTLPADLPLASTPAPMTVSTSRANDEARLSSRIGRRLGVTLTAIAVAAVCLVATRPRAPQAASHIVPAHVTERAPPAPEAATPAPNEPIPTSPAASAVAEATPPTPASPSPATSTKPKSAARSPVPRRALPVKGPTKISLPASHR